MNRRSTALTVSFIGLGASGATIPALLPVLAAKWAISPALVSPLLSVLFLGLALSVVSAALLGGRLSSLTMLVGGEFLQATGLVILVIVGTATDGRVGGRIAALVLGVGFGLTEVCAVRLARSHVGMLSGLTGILAVTSAAAPVLIGVAAGFGRWQEAVLGAAALHVLGAVLLLSVWGRRGGSDAPAKQATAPGEWRSLRPRREHLAFFAYVGAETTLAAWFGTAAMLAFDLSVGQAAAATSGFWLCLAAGRFAAVPILRNHSAAAVLRICVIIATSFLAIAWIVGALWSTGLGLLIPMLLGLVLLGPIYGLLAAVSPQAVTDRGMAGLIAAGAVGGSAISAISSWVVGESSVVGASAVARAVGVAAIAILLAALVISRPPTTGRHFSEPRSRT